MTCPTRRPQGWTLPRVPLRYLIRRQPTDKGATSGNCPDRINQQGADRG